MSEADDSVIPYTNYDYMEDQKRKWDALYEESPSEPISDEEIERLVRLATEDEFYEEPIIPTLFEVTIECKDELEQKVIFERLLSEGYRCQMFLM